MPRLSRANLREAKSKQKLYSVSRVFLKKICDDYFNIFNVLNILKHMFWHMFGFYVIKADMDDTLMDEICPLRNRM